jgi:glycosyltransferase involved in cell wall biosynthesis
MASETGLNVMIGGGSQQGGCRRPRICLISAVQPWVNPRLIKEADTLASEGCEVRVITLNQDSWSSARDDELLRTKTWTISRINLVKEHPMGRLRWFTAALRAKLAFQLSKTFPGVLRFAEESYYRGYGSALAQAKRWPADLYIAHTQSAISIAARAARRHNVPFAFDCEDLNADANADGGRNPYQRRNILAIERAYLKDAAYVTATSAPMASLLAERHGIKKPTIIYNVFPAEELKPIMRPKERPPSDVIKMVWMSVTIGPGRGLEDAIRALSILPQRYVLTVFGILSPDFGNELKSLVRAQGVENRVEFRPIPPPEKVMETISQHDIGLALDDGNCKNLALTICNKFFLYLQAGLLVICTDIPGQKSVYEQHPQIGAMVSPGDYRGLAEKVAFMTGAKTDLLLARDVVWVISQENFSWDIEKRKFMACIRQALKLAPQPSDASISAPAL